MTQSKVYLVKGEERIDINQQPGIPYFVTARLLGGDKIIVEKGNAKVEFGIDQVPEIN